MSDLIDDVDDLVEGDESDSSTIKALRAKLKELNSSLKAERTEKEELLTFRTETVEKAKANAIGSAFKEAGLSEKQVPLFKSLNPDVAPEDVTKEAVLTFAAEYDLPLASGEQAEKPKPKEEGFTPVTTGNAPSEGIISIEEASKMIREGRYDEAQKLYEQGRVQKFERDANGAPIVDWLAKE